MANYRLTNEAKEDLLRIHEFGTFAFGIKQADKYLNDFFDCFELISREPLAFESVDQI
ncbi:MAG: type II toxin-antitoxin system RelE/ParE family toxin [Bacteroidia bacterium]